MDTPHAHADLIRALGGPAAVARLLKVKPPSVVDWKRTGIPEGRLVRLAVIAEEREHCRRWDLFPNDWHRIWPELIGTEGAPAVPAEAAAAEVAHVG